MNPKSEYFRKDIEKLHNPVYQEFITHYFDHVVPEWFWRASASSSGKYHPKFSQGEGGLVRHSRAVFYFTNEGLRMWDTEFTEKEQDWALMAALVHDCAKYGMTNVFEKSAFRFHDVNGADLFEDAWLHYFQYPAPEPLLDCIRGHMGKWASKPELKPKALLTQIVFNADYFASRKDIDFSILVEDYEVVRSEYHDSKFPF